MTQAELIEKISSALEQNPQIQAAWLTGSFGRGDFDQYSDIDVIVLCEDSDANALFRLTTKELQAISPVLFTKTLEHSKTINVITPDWLRFDLTFVSADQLKKISMSEVKLLFAKKEPDLNFFAIEPQKTDIRPETITTITNEFIRVIGLMPVVIARNEFIVGQTGSNLLREMLIQIMTLENGPQPIRGTLSLSRSLTREQASILGKLPPLAAQKNAIIEANKAIAAQFFPRAYALATKKDAIWPEKFKTVTAKFLKEALGVDIISS